MSCTININGHKDGLDADTGAAFEEEIQAKAREFVAGLEGVTSATWSSAYLPAGSLLASE